MTSGMIVYVYSERFEQSARFYREALGIEGQAAGPIWMAFPVGASRFALHRQDPQDPRPEEPFRLDFLVDDLETALRRFEAAGASLVRGIQDEAFGRSAVLRDPEGRELTLVQEELA